MSYSDAVDRFVRELERDHIIPEQNGARALEIRERLEKFINPPAPDATQPEGDAPDAA